VKRGSFRDWRDARVDVEDYQELDIERILALLDLIGRGRASGVEIGSRGRATAEPICSTFATEESRGWLCTSTASTRSRTSGCARSESIRSRPLDVRLTGADEEAFVRSRERV
jgi:hypothetical protein